MFEDALAVALSCDGQLMGEKITELKALGVEFWQEELQGQPGVSTVCPANSPLDYWDDDYGDLGFTFEGIGVGMGLTLSKDASGRVEGSARFQEFPAPLGAIVEGPNGPYEVRGKTFVMQGGAPYPVTCNPDPTGWVVSFDIAETNQLIPGCFYEITPGFVSALAQVDKWCALVEQQMLEGVKEAYDAYDVRWIVGSYTTVTWSEGEVQRDFQCTDGIFETAGGRSAVQEFYLASAEGDNPKVDGFGLRTEWRLADENFRSWREGFIAPMIEIKPSSDAPWVSIGGWANFGGDGACYNPLEFVFADDGWEPRATPSCRR